MARGQYLALSKDYLLLFIIIIAVVIYIIISIINSKSLGGREIFEPLLSSNQLCSLSLRSLWTFSAIS